MKTLLLSMILLALAAGPVAAQDVPAPDESPAQVHEAIQEYFAKRLRSELALDDEQIGKIVPRIRELERAKVDAKRERMETARGLRRAMERGAPDAELKKMLDRLDRIELDQRERERKTLHEIDRELTVRQSVKLRFFMPRFRSDMQKRVREFREDRVRERERGRDLPRRRRPAGRPGR